MVVLKIFIIQPPSQDYCVWNCFSKFHIQAPRENIDLGLTIWGQISKKILMMLNKIKSYHCKLRITASKSKR